jgi:hypothetical protein
MGGFEFPQGKNAIVQGRPFRKPTVTILSLAQPTAASIF